MKSNADNGVKVSRKNSDESSLQKLGRTVSEQSSK